MIGCVSEYDDAQAVYAALEAASPQDASELAEATRIHGRRLEAAVELLEGVGRVERHSETDGGNGYSFSWVQLA
jgi:hypothetical protein